MNKCSLATTMLLACSGLASACVTVPDDAGFSDVARGTSERESKKVTWTKGERDEASERIVREILSRELDIDGAVQVALLRQPRLQAIYEELEVSRAELVQALLPNNPEIDVGLRIGVPSLAGLELDASIVEDVTSLLFMPLRARLAGTALDAAKLRVTDAVLAEVASVKDAFARHVAAQEILAVETTYAVAAEAAADVAERQLAAGTENELFRATKIAESLEARLHVADAEMQVVETREELLRAMGLFGAETALKMPQQLPSLPLADVAVDDLEARAVAARFDIAAEKLAVDMAAQRLSLAQPWLVPFFNAGVGSELEDGAFGVGPSIGFSLPLLDWGQARRMGLEASKRAAERRVEALAIDVRSHVRESAARMVAARAKVNFIRGSLLPARQAQLELSVQHYNRMMIGVFDLLRARQDQLDAERDDVRARESYWIARAELERAVGGRLPSLVASDASTPTPTREGKSGSESASEATTPQPAQPAHDGHN